MNKNKPLYRAVFITKEYGKIASDPQESEAAALIALGYRAGLSPCTHPSDLDGPAQILVEPLGRSGEDARWEVSGEERTAELYDVCLAEFG